MEKASEQRKRMRTPATLLSRFKFKDENRIRVELEIIQEIKSSAVTGIELR